MDSQISKISPQGANSSPVFSGDNRRKTTDPDSYFNSQFDARPIYLEPGDAVWSDDQSAMIVATVGSGVIVSINDTELQMGVLGYVLAPEALLQAFPYFDKIDSAVLRKAFMPIEDCIGQMKRHGAGKGRIRLRLMGGGQMPGDSRDSGTKNCVFTREYVVRKGLPVLNEDLGGLYARRVHYFPATGCCVRRVLRRKSDFEYIRDIESEYQMRLQK